MEETTGCNARRYDLRSGASPEPNAGTHRHPRRSGDCQVLVDGGEGVGRVTGPGLQIPAGYAAINPVPRKMIAQQVRAACQHLGCNKPVQVIVSVENGRELARKTFNPRLGIEGGISILGTTGIVEPMSEQALVETIHILVDKARLHNPNTILLAPGNYGKDYCLHQLGWTWKGSEILQFFRRNFRLCKISRVSASCCWWGMWANW